MKGVVENLVIQSIECTCRFASSVKGNYMRKLTLSDIGKKIPRKNNMPNMIKLKSSMERSSKWMKRLLNS